MSKRLPRTPDQVRELMRDVGPMVASSTNPNKNERFDMTKQCLEFSDKKRYNTQKDAELTILLQENQNLKIYKCSTCNGWHLTSKI